MSNKKRIKKRLSDLKKTKRIHGVLILGNGSIIHLRNITQAKPRLDKARAISHSLKLNFWYPYEEEKKDA